MAILPRACSRRTAGQIPHMCVFFWPDRFAANDLGWPLFKDFERDITLLYARGGKGCAMAYWLAVDFCSLTRA
jgi:hypothetical protein